MNGVVGFVCVCMRCDGKEHSHKTQEGGSSAYVSSLKRSLRGGFVWRLAWWHDEAGLRASTLLAHRC